MDFAWEELTDAERAQAYADWEAGKGLIGGSPLQRPGSHLLPVWGIDLPFFRTLALADDRGRNGVTLRAQLASSKPLEVEIGFGRGDFLLDRAQRHPDRLFFGYETKTKATRLMLTRIERQAVEHALSDAGFDDAASGSATTTRASAYRACSMPDALRSSTCSFPIPGGKTNTKSGVSSRRHLSICLLPDCKMAAWFTSKAMFRSMASWCVTSSKIIPNFRHMIQRWRRSSATPHRPIANTGAQYTVSRSVPTTLRANNRRR
jgi:hypothetical protein